MSATKSSLHYHCVRTALSTDSFISGVKDKRKVKFIITHLHVVLGSRIRG
jgi:hypothetical protein